jgi:hypothetical protein
MYSGIKSRIVYIHTCIHTYDVKTDVVVITYLHLGLDRFHNLRAMSQIFANNHTSNMDITYRFCNFNNLRYLRLVAKMVHTMLQNIMNKC